MLAPAKVTFSIQFHRLLEGSLQIKVVVALRPAIPHSAIPVSQELTHRMIREELEASNEKQGYRNPRFHY